MSSPSGCAVFIPLRGGSKSIPMKNIRPLAGRPLAGWTVQAANDAKGVDAVFVATDSEEIAEVVKSFRLPKVQVIGRSAETATDTASTESALLEFAAAHPEFDTVVLVQATSPLLTADDLEGGLAHFRDTGADTLLSVVRQKRFIWETTPEGFANAVNYTPSQRPRRQEFDGYLVENGAFYVMKREGLLTHGNRLHGRIASHEMAEETYVEIDEPSDWLFVESLLRKRQRRPAPQIRMLVTDVDGVLTDAGMYYSERGDELKKFNTRDGMGIRLLRERGIIVGIITGENTRIVDRRAEKLGLDFVHQGISNKIEVLREECCSRGIALAEVAYIGDDINDLECLMAVGEPACPADALPPVLLSGAKVMKAKGGEGAVREFADYLITNCGVS